MGKEPERPCRCPETRYEVRGLDGQMQERQVVPPEHSCAYVAMRNRMIPEAVRRANAVAALRRPEWAAAFMGAMTLLVEEAKAKEAEIAAPLGLGR